MSASPATAEPGRGRERDATKPVLMTVQGKLQFSKKPRDGLAPGACPEQSESVALASRGQARNDIQGSLKTYAESNGKR
jgi:hypothetical protein